eukprot:CAMPEP_0204594996 /NCGR_PEP_ID=MMETSP0661-20131031/52408_1 /ASSEMBLY_ACC=CAM_ASM_000606 /TAXON_ID=109239 /ORGANISM="Alexandrium margalefi, Strain AMGDE01CS-322" /LENGTH=165 /DNA_ID=CAMNT_0051605465 /DNA_START=70 /DNA_END=564 /DNA_ORIENTATION=+
MSSISAPVDYLPYHSHFPSAYTELKDVTNRTVVNIDIRTLDPRAPTKGLPPDERYVEGVYVDGENGPMKLQFDGSWVYMQHDFRCSFAKRNQLALHTKRWTTMSQSEKEAFLHLTAKRNWRMRGMLDQRHPEFRSRDFPTVGEALAVLDTNRKPVEKKKKKQLVD